MCLPHCLVRDGRPSEQATYCGREPPANVLTSSDKSPRGQSCSLWLCPVRGRAQEGTTVSPSLSLQADFWNWCRHHTGVTFIPGVRAMGELSVYEALFLWLVGLKSAIPFLLSPLPFLWTQRLSCDDHLKILEQMCVCGYSNYSNDKKKKYTLCWKIRLGGRSFIFLLFTICLWTAIKDSSLSLMSKGSEGAWTSDVIRLPCGSPATWKCVLSCRWSGAVSTNTWDLRCRAGDGVRKVGPLSLCCNLPLDGTGGGEQRDRFKRPRGVQELFLYKRIW